MEQGRFSDKLTQHTRELILLQEESERQMKTKESHMQHHGTLLWQGSIAGKYRNSRWSKRKGMMQVLRRRYWCPAQGPRASRGGRRLQGTLRRQPGHTVAQGSGTLGTQPPPVPVPRQMMGAAGPQGSCSVSPCQDPCFRAVAGSGHGCGGVRKTHSFHGGTFSTWYQGGNSPCHRRRGQSCRTCQNCQSR